MRAVHSAYFQVLGDHGFIGLALFLFMFFLGFRNCRRVVRECSELEDLHWLVYLARMLEVGFIGFAVGAAALSAAYYDVFLVLILSPRRLRTLAVAKLQFRMRVALHTPAEGMQWLQGFSLSYRWPKSFPATSKEAADKNAPSGSKCNCSRRVSYSRRRCATEFHYRTTNLV